jgi:hypothetical protein
MIGSGGSDHALALVDKSALHAFRRFRLKRSRSSAAPIARAVMAFARGRLNAALPRSMRGIGGGQPEAGTKADSAGVARRRHG